MLQQRLSTVNRQQSLEAELYHGDSMAPRKNRQNDRQAICFLYASSVVAASLSLAVASMQYADQNDHRSLTAEWGRPLFVSSLYATSCLILLAMAGYFESHRSETFEAVHRGTGPVPFSVKFSIKGEKVNLYLRLGLAMFGIMSIGHVAVKFVEDKSTTSNEFCLYLKSILEMAFFVLQTLFILRYHRLVILRYNEAMGAGLVHLLTTNLCVWTDISVGKIDKTLSYGKQWRTRSGVMEQYYGVSDHVNSNQSHGADFNRTTHSLNLLDISFYLLPTVSEYCLLAAALLYEITVRIGQPSFIEIEKTKEGKPTNQHRKQCRDCSTSAGSWFGIITVLLVIALTLVTSTTPKYIDITANFWKSVIILAEEAILCLFGIGFVIVAFYQTRKLKFSIATRQSHVEEFLLYTAFFFSANYTISTMILSADFEDENRNFNSLVTTERYLLICRCTLNAFELVQIVFQTYMIQDSFHRCSDRLKHQITKPGRQAIVALLGINLAFWIQQSFQLKNADILFLIESDKGAYGWILYVVTMPISLFYRYHCTVCLSQCFNKLYEDETHRFEEIWRYRVDPLTDMVIPAMGSIGIYGQEECSLLDSREPKMSDASIIAPNTRCSRLAAFARTKPWKTIDFPDQHQSTLHEVEPMIAANEFTSKFHVQDRHPQDTEDRPSNDTETDKVELMPLQNTMGGSNRLENKSGMGHLGESNGSKLHLDTANSGESQTKFLCQAVHSQTESAGPSPSHQSMNVTPSRKVKEEQSQQLPVKVVTTKVTASAAVTQCRASNIPMNRRQASSLKLTRNPWINDDDWFRSEFVVKSSGLSKSPRHSFTKQFPQAPPPIRRRRTLRNLETAKYRVLAAELAHRMVIERGGTTNTNGHTTTLSDKSPDSTTDGIFSLKFSELAQNTVHSLSAVPTLARTKSSSHHGSGRKADYRVAQAMTETAAITIAPVEAQLAISLQPGLNFLHPDEDSTVMGGDLKSPKKRRLRQSLFMSSRPGFSLTPKQDKRQSAHSTPHSPETHQSKTSPFESRSRPESLSSVTHKTESLGTGETTATSNGTGATKNAAMNASHTHRQQ